jgi:hypothetical protein
MNAGKWVVLALLMLGPVCVQAFGIEDAAQGMAEKAARKAATGAAKDAVNSVLDDDQKGNAKGKGHKKAKKGHQGDPASPPHSTGDQPKK